MLHYTIKKNEDVWGSGGIAPYITKPDAWWRLSGQLYASLCLPHPHIHLIGVWVDHTATLDCEEKTKFCPKQESNCDPSTVQSAVQLLYALTGNCEWGTDVKVNVVRILLLFLNSFQDLRIYWSLRLYRCNCLNYPFYGETVLITPSTIKINLDHVQMITQVIPHREHGGFTSERPIVQSRVGK